MAMNTEALDTLNRNFPDAKAGVDTSVGYLLDPTPGIFTRQKSLPELESLLSSDPTITLTRLGRRKQIRGLKAVQTLPERHVASEKRGEVSIAKVFDEDGKITDITVSRNTGVPFSHTKYTYETIPLDAASGQKRWVLTSEVTKVKQSEKSKTEFEASHANYHYDVQGNLAKAELVGNEATSAVFALLTPKVGETFEVNVDELFSRFKKEDRPDVQVIPQDDGSTLVRVFTMGKGTSFASAPHFTLQNDYVIRNGRTEEIRVYRGYAGESEFSFAYGRDGRYGGRVITYAYDGPEKRNLCLSEESADLQSGTLVR